MGVTQYVGARYVPIFADPAEWTSTRTYEPLTIVMHEGNSFTSKQFVPVGINIDNDDFWAETGNYNAQVEAYREETIRYREELDSFIDDIEEKSFSFPTVNEMVESENLFNGAICHTSGFNSVNDNGSAWYTITDNATPNGMDIIKCGNLYAILLPVNNMVTPEMFGAFGDGISDDTNNVQRCFNYAGTNNAEIVCSGIYLLNQTVYVYRAITVHGICATGIEQIAASKWQAKSRFVINHDGIGIYIKKEGLYGQVFEGGSFEYVGINPSDNHANDSNIVGIRIEAWSHFTFANVAFSRFFNGIALQMQNGGQYSDIVNCKFENNLVAISEQPKQSDANKFYVGVHVDNCYFDSNGNGTLFNHDPRPDSIGIDLYSGANWNISNTRFQGIEKCIKTGSGYYTTISNCRFEMFTYGIEINGQHCVVSTGNRFDGYLGTSGRTKIAILINESANFTVIYSIETSSLQYIPIRDYGNNTRNYFYQHVSMFIKEISESSYIPLGFAKYRGIISNFIMSTGRISSNGGFGNEQENHWNMAITSAKPPEGAQYFTTVGKEWGKSTRYEKMQVVDKINNPDLAGTPVQVGNTFTFYIGKSGAPETLKDVLIDFDFIYWY